MFEIWWFFDVAMMLLFRLLDLDWSQSLSMEGY